MHALPAFEHNPRDAVTYSDFTVQIKTEEVVRCKIDKKRGFRVSRETIRKMCSISTCAPDALA